MVYIISDPHIGHRNIAKYRPFVTSDADNTAQFKDQWRKQKIKGKDMIYCLGDAAFTKEALDVWAALPGRKILIKGNHDDLVSTRDQLQVFEEIHGMLSYKDFWLTHCPIHAVEMRKKKGNIHGHVHQHSVMKTNLLGRQSLDKRYFNACVDVVYPKYDSWFVTLDQVRDYFS